MSCLVSRENGSITKVLLPDGQTESKTYWDILRNLESVPEESVQSMIESVRPLQGKYIQNLTDPREIALGLYLNTYSQRFRNWFGETGVKNELGEPALVNYRGQLVYALNENPDPGEVRHFYTPVVNEPKSEVFRSIATRKKKQLLKSIQMTNAVLRERIERLDEARQKAKLDSKLSPEEKIAKDKYYREEIAKLQEAIKHLVEKNAVDYVFIQAVADLDFVESLLKSDKINFGELEIAKTAVATWQKLKDVLGIEALSEITDERQLELARQIVYRAQFLDQDLFNLNVKLVQDNAAKVVKGFKKSQGTEKGDAELFRDVNALTRSTLDITRTGVKIVDYLGEIINRLNTRIKKERNDNHDRVNQAFEKLKNHPEFKKRGFDIFIKDQTDKLGNSTIGLRTRYSQAYYDTMKTRFKIFNAKKNAAKQKGDKAEVNRLYKELNEWMNKHKHVFNLSAFIEEDVNGKLVHDDAARQKVIDEIKALGFTEEEVNDIIQSQKKRYEQYKADLFKQEQLLKIGIQSGEIDLEGKTEDEYLNDAIKRWKELNNPISYMKQIETGKPDSLHATLGYKYTISIPRKTIDGKDSGYYDPEFTAIANDKVLYEFYLFTRDFLAEQLRHLPEEKVQDLQSNFLPVIAKELAGEYSKLSAKGWLQGMDDWFMKVMTSVDFVDNEERNPLTGLKINKFQSRFLDPSEVDTEKRSRDLVAMMKLFADMAGVYKHKLLMQDEVESINNLIQKSNRQIVKGRMSKEEAVEKAPENVQKMVESAILRSFYNKPPEKQWEVKTRKFYNSLELLSFGLYKSPEYKQAKIIEDQLAEFEKKLQNDALPKKEKEDLEKKRVQLMKQYEKLGGRQFAWSKATDALVTFTRAKGIAFNPLSAFRNLAVGGINNFIHATGGEDFTTGHLTKAVGILKASSARYLSWGMANSATAEKILRIMIDTGTIDGEDGIFKSGVLGRNPTLETIKKILPSPFGLMRSTDYFFKSQTTLSLMLATKVKTSKGEFNLFEILNKDKEIDTAKYGEWVAEENGGKSFEEFYEDFLIKNAQLTKRLHGFSGDTLSLEGKDHAIGRMIFLFRTWLPETFANRFEARSYDVQLGRDVEGYYRTFFLNITKGSIPKMIQAVFNAQSADTMDATERANLRKMFTELMAIVTLLGLYFTLKALGPDDDDDPKARKHWNLVLNQVDALRRDLTYYSDPGSFGELVNSLFPVISTFTQAGEAMKAVTYYTFGVENEDGELEYDGERTILKVTKALPYLNNVNRVQYQMEKVL